MNVRAFNINYDTDGDTDIAESLPKELIFNYQDREYEDDEREDIEDTLSTRITNVTGWVVFNCSYEIM